MQTTSLRLRLAPTVEWVVAAVFLAATVFVALLLVRELRGPSVVPTPLRAAPTASAAPAVPERAISVPALLLANGAQIRVGDTAEQLQRTLAGATTIGTEVLEAGPLGQRSIRSYDHHGTRFLLVLEPFERHGAPRVAGIYLQ